VPEEDVLPLRVPLSLGDGEVVSVAVSVSVGLPDALDVADRVPL